MLVLAFDGVLFDTLEARALVVRDALTAHGLHPAAEHVRDAVAGRTLAEAVRWVVLQSRGDQLDGTARDEASRRSSFDETSLDIASLHASQMYTALAARGFAVHVPARELLLRAASTSRIVVRADSRRREVDALLAMAGLENAVSMSRCSDDPGGGHASAHADSPSHTRPRDADNIRPLSVERSYAAISARMAHTPGFLGERVVGVAIEAGALARDAALRHGFDVVDRVSALDAGNR